MSILRVIAGGSFAFWCPGCGDAHVVRTGEHGWTFNGNLECPSFQPSVLVTSGHFIDGFKTGDRCWCTYAAEHNGVSPFKCRRCHSFVTDGKINYLPDSSHFLVGKAVPLPEFPIDYHTGEV